jgi:hypothetical protein
VSDRPTTQRRRPTLSPLGRSTLQERITFGIGVAFVLIAPSTIGLLTSNPTLPWVSLVSGAFITIVSKIDSLAEFSLGPLKARMREAVEEATATIDQLRDLATSVTSAFLTNLIAGSFMGGMSNDRRFRMHDELMKQLTLLGASEQHLRRADEEWRSGVGVIFHRIIGSRMITEAKPSTTKDHNDLHSEIQALLDFPNLKAAAPEHFEDFALKHNILTTDVQAWIDDYRHFQLTGEIRRRDEFMMG